MEPYKLLGKRDALDFDDDNMVINSSHGSHDYI